MGSHPTFVALIYDVSTASRPWRSRNVLQEFKCNPQKKRVLLLDRGEVEPENIFEVRLQEFKYNPQNKRVLLLDRGEVEPCCKSSSTILKKSEYCFSTVEK